MVLLNGDPRKIRSVVQANIVGFRPSGQAMLPAFLRAAPRDFDPRFLKKTIFVDPWEERVSGAPGTQYTNENILGRFVGA